MGGCRRRKHKKSSSTSRQVEKDENTVLVESLTRNGEGDHTRIDLHLVDLKQRAIKINYSPSLVHLNAVSSMVDLGHSVYLFGIPSFDEEPRINIPLDRTFRGSSRLDLTLNSDNLDNSQRGVWSEAPFPDTAGRYPRCISLFGKLYNFGNICLEPSVFDSNVGHWIPLLPVPPHLVGCRVSNFAIQDSSNDRILVHLSGGQLSSPSLYAFTPSLDDHYTSSSGTWTCIASEFYLWTSVAAVDDGVIYFHKLKCPFNIRAFDITSGTWLTLRWSSSFENNLDLNYTIMYFSALLRLGDRILCFVYWTSTYDSDGQFKGSININFAKFKVKLKRKSNPPILSLIPMSYQTYELPGVFEANHFIASSQVQPSKENNAQVFKNLCCSDSSREPNT